MGNSDVTLDWVELRPFGYRHYTEAADIKAYIAAVEHWDVPLNVSGAKLLLAIIPDSSTETPAGRAVVPVGSRLPPVS